MTEIEAPRRRVRPPRWTVAAAGRWTVAAVALAAALTAVSGAADAPRIAIDDGGRLVVHGTPRFVLGVYDSGLGYTLDRGAWERILFAPGGARQLDGVPINMYINYHLGGAPIEATQALMDTLWKRRIMYLQTGNCFAKGSWTRYGPGSFSIMFDSYVRKFARHPGAAGYYIMDECDDSLVGETEQHHRSLKKVDPGGLTFAVAVAAAYRDPARWVNAADVLAMDPYPMYGKEPAAGYPHFVVADSVARLRAAVPPQRPVWAVLQFFQFTSDSRQPTYEELRTHAVMSIVEGAQGLLWWEIGPNGLRKADAATVTRQMAALRELTKELARLEEALVAPPARDALARNSTAVADRVAGRKAQLEHNIAVEWLYSRKVAYRAELEALGAGNTAASPMLTGTVATVRTLTKVVGDTGYVFAYNYTNTPAPARFTWHRPPSRVVESRDGRVLPVSDATWGETFGAYEARIYIITP